MAVRSPHWDKQCCFDREKESRWPVGRSAWSNKGNGSLWCMWRRQGIIKACLSFIIMVMIKTAKHLSPSSWAHTHTHCTDCHVYHICCCVKTRSPFSVKPDIRRAEPCEICRSVQVLSSSLGQHSLIPAHQKNILIFARKVLSVFFVCRSAIRQQWSQCHFRCFFWRYLLSDFFYLASIHLVMKTDKCW